LRETVEGLRKKEDTYLTPCICSTCQAPYYIWDSSDPCNKCKHSEAYEKHAAWHAGLDKRHFNLESWCLWISIVLAAVFILALAALIK